MSSESPKQRISTHAKPIPDDLHPFGKKLSTLSVSEGKVYKECPSMVFRPPKLSSHQDLSIYHPICCLVKTNM